MPPKANPQPPHRGPLGPWAGVGGVDNFANSSYAASANVGHRGVSQQFTPLLTSSSLVRSLVRQLLLFQLCKTLLVATRLLSSRSTSTTYKIWFILDQAVADKIVELFSRLPVRTIASF
jgi:hypothetical protein